MARAGVGALWDTLGWDLLPGKGVTLGVIQVDGGAAGGWGVHSRRT